MRTTCLCILFSLIHGAALAQTPEEKVKQLQATVAAETQKAETRTRPLATIQRSEVQLQRRLFEDVFRSVSELPPDKRTVNARLLSAQGNIAAAWTGLPFACGWRIRVVDNNFRATGQLRFDRLDWLQDGRARVSTNIAVDAEAQLEFVAAGIPYPDLACRIAQHRECRKVLWWEVCVDLPYPVCDFRGWRPCSEGTIGGEFRLGSFRATKVASLDRTVTAEFSELGDDDKRVAGVMSRQEGLGSAAIAGQLGIPVAAVDVSLTRLRETGLADKDVTKLLPKGRPFAWGSDHWLAYRFQADDNELPMDVNVSVRMPNPLLFGHDLFCNLFGSVLRPWCAFSVVDSRPSSAGPKLPETVGCRSNL